MINKAIYQISLLLILTFSTTLLFAPSGWGETIASSQEGSMLSHKLSAVENKIDVIDGKCTGWIKKSSLDRCSKYFPYLANINGDYIYSQPNTSEVYKIGHGMWNDPVEVFYEENKNDITWAYISFEEVYLLKNKMLRNILISQFTKNIIGVVGVIIGAGVGSSLANKNDPKYLGAIVLYAIGGGIIGAMVSTFSVNVYNSRLLNEYHKEQKGGSNEK